MFPKLQRPKHLPLKSLNLNLHSSEMSIATEILLPSFLTYKAKVKGYLFQCTVVDHFTLIRKSKHHSIERIGLELLIIIIIRKNSYTLLIGLCWALSYIHYIHLPSCPSQQSVLWVLLSSPSHT